jgi:DNA-directed RNA polymerase subunit RPC12/RpoP
MPYNWTEARLKIWGRTLKLYGLKPRELNDLRTRLLVAQGYKCAICGTNFSGRVAFLDHDHHSGALRGVLCFRCNRLYVAKNSRETAVEVVRYLNDPPAHKFLSEWGIEPHGG